MDTHLPRLADWRRAKSEPTVSLEAMKIASHLRCSTTARLWMCLVSCACGPSDLGGAPPAQDGAVGLDAGASHDEGGDLRTDGATSCAADGGQLASPDVLALRLAKFLWNSSAPTP